LTYDVHFYSPGLFELQAIILILSAVTVSLSNLNVAFFRINVHTSSQDRYVFRLPLNVSSWKISRGKRTAYLEGKSGLDVVGEFIGDGLVKLLD